MSYVSQQQIREQRAKEEERAKRVEKILKEWEQVKRPQNWKLSLPKLLRMPIEKIEADARFHEQAHCLPGL